MLRSAVEFLLGTLIFLWGRHAGRAEVKAKISNWIRFRLVETQHYRVDAVSLLTKLNERLREI